MHDASVTQSGRGSAHLKLTADAQRTVRHSNNHAAKGTKCSFLAETYAGGRTQQFSVPREQVVEVRRRLDNCQKRKQAIEDICETQS
jgi:hypothetical protein